MTENVEKSKASKRPIRENSPMARAMAAAARAAILDVWFYSGGPLADLFDERTAVAVYEAMRDRADDWLPVLPLVFAPPKLPPDELDVIIEV